jgi:hypothetical protein
MTTREEIIAAAKLCEYWSGQAIEVIGRFYAIAQASRDAEVAFAQIMVARFMDRLDALEAERDQLREQVKMLSAWIKQQGEITDTCTFNILREVCENCACHRNKALAAKESRK